MGINKINDILQWGKIVTAEQFYVRFHCHPPPFLLPSLQNHIPNNWLDKMTMVDPVLSGPCLYIKNEKGTWADFQRLTTKNIYTNFEQRKSKGYTCADRWLKAYDREEVFGSEQRWRSWNTLPYKITHEVQLQTFAFKIWYRIIPCKVFPKQLRVLERENCARCTEKDDLFHFFFECPIVKTFWDNLATWMGRGDGGNSGFSRGPHRGRVSM